MKSVWLLGLAVTALVASSSGIYAATRARDVEAVTDVHLRGAGESLIGPGDVNGDGNADIAVSECVGRDPRSAIYVVFGPFENAADMIVEKSDGFVINVPETNMAPVCLTAAAGDVNDDGLGDLLVSHSTADNNARGDSGTAYVVFGKADSEPVDLASFDQGTQMDAGYRIDGPVAGGLAADSVAGLGDVNGDGRDDVAVAAPFAGSVYVVFGKSDPTPVDLLRFDLGTQVAEGFRIDTGVPNRNIGQIVGATGDVNADGAADVGVGYIPKLSSKGFAYVVFGKNDALAVDVHDLGASGFEVVGAKARSSFGQTISEAGDVNQDGHADVMIAAPYRNCCGVSSTYLIFGKEDSGSTSVRDLGDGGYRIVGGYNDFTGLAMSRLGDTNCDGLPDMVIGESSSSHNGRLSGSVYVIYGKKSSARLKVSDLGRRGYRIDGASARDQLGTYVAGPGDVSGDGAPDLMTQKTVGADVTYLVFGRPCRTDDPLG